jgi:hypothetical protein
MKNHVIEKVVKTRIIDNTIFSGFKPGYLYIGQCPNCNLPRIICGHEIKVNQENTNE